MPAANQGTVPSKAQAALRTLQSLNIPLRGPFITRKGRRIFLVDGCILTEPEIIVLHEDGKFDPENIGKLLSDLKSLQRTEPQEVQRMSEADPRNRRRSQRVMLQVAVLVKAEMPAGKRVQTQAFTVVVNAHGGLMESPFRMTVGQRITLVNPQSGKEVGCRVVRVQKSSEEGFTTAFEFEERSARFWPVTFPPVDWAVTEELA